MPCAGIDGNPFHDITRLAFERNTPLYAKNPNLGRGHTQKFSLFFHYFQGAGTERSGGGPGAAPGSAGLPPFCTPPF